MNHILTNAQQVNQIPNIIPIGKREKNNKEKKRVKHVNKSFLSKNITKSILPVEPSALFPVACVPSIKSVHTFTHFTTAFNRFSPL